MKNSPLQITLQKKTATEDRKAESKDERKMRAKRETF
jgi:hypothetical protein